MPDKKGIFSKGLSGIIVSLAILVVYLLGAGCISTSTPADSTGKGTPASQGAGTLPVSDACTFDHEMERTAGTPGLDTCYFTSHSPLDYLNDLRTHPMKPVMVLRTRMTG